MDRLWGSPGMLAEDDARVVDSEEYAADVILPNVGFESIILTRDFDRGFPLDILAKKQGVWYGFDMTLACTAKAKPRKTRLFEHLGIKTAMLFLKPDKTMYFLKEYDSSKTHISCITDFKAVVKS